MDAISFVLGIKSSHLRSTQLKELEYRRQIVPNGVEEEMEYEDENREDDEENKENEENGARVRKTWVMAVYETNDGIQLKYKRVITPAGASEFSINSKVVQASAYNKSLEEQNILIKARNFLVFQGDVEAVASQSPRDLTRLIEQISGSLELKAEYEKLKAEYETATESSTHEFQRKKGIAQEIKFFSEQKAVAEKYEAKRDERANLILQYNLWKLFSFDKVKEDAKDKIAEGQIKLGDAERTQRKAEELYNAEKQALAHLQKRVLQEEAVVKARERELQQINAPNKEVTAKMNLLQKQVDNIRKRAHDVELDQTKLLTSRSKIAKDLATVQKGEAKFMAEQKKASRDKGLALTDEQQEQYLGLKAQINQNMREVMERMEPVKDKMSAQKSAVDDTQSQIDSLNMQKENLRVVIRQLVSQKEEETTTVNSLLLNMDHKKSEIEEIKSQRVQKELKRTELNEKLAACLKKLMDINAERRQSEREVKLQQQLANLKVLFPGVRGRLVDLCKPSQRKYELAISTILGRNVNSVVVDTERTAKECIEYLRDQRAGEATFIPLDTIIVKPVQAALRNVDAQVKLALDCVNFDARMERALQYACGNAIVCDNVSIARKMCYERKVDVKGQCHVLQLFC